MMLDTRTQSFSAIAERELRQQVDLSVSRALFDRDYLSLLLNDPTIVLGGEGCPPQQFKSLRSIRATDIFDFARQAQKLFWIVEPEPVPDQEQLPLAAAAAR
jgi:hypothetical protein